MKIHDFYRRFEELPREKRFELIEFTPETTSFFIIYQRLGQVRKQKEYFEEQERHLLKQAEEAFKKYVNNI